MAIIPEGAAARSRRARWAMAAVAVTVVVADQVTKSLVAAGRIADGSTFGWVTVRVVRNHGASGGIASGYPVLVTIAALAITALAAALALRASRPDGRHLPGGGARRRARQPVRPDLPLPRVRPRRRGRLDSLRGRRGGGSLDVSDLAIQFGVLGAVAAMLITSGVSARRARKSPESLEQPEPRCMPPMVVTIKGAIGPAVCRNHGASMYGSGLA